MDCLGQSMDPYFERAIHGLSKAQNDTQRGIGAGHAYVYHLKVKCYMCFNRLSDVWKI